MPRAPRVALALAAVAITLAPATATASPIALGAYIPGASERPQLINRFAGEIGYQPRIVLSYKNWSSLPFSRTELDAIWRRGAIPMITWEPWTSSERGFSLRQIANGRFDRYLRRAAGSAALWGKPLFVRFAQEMNGDWAPWGAGVNGNTARDYRKAWKHIVNLFRFHGATNVIWVWCVNEDAGGNFNFGSYYPGDDWVDWVAIDGFDFGASSESWPSFTTIFGSTYERLTAITNRPLMVAETAANQDGGDKAAWITSALSREAPRFTRLRALVWFGDRKSNGDFRVDSSPQALTAFRRAVASHAYSATRHDLLTAADASPGGRSAAPAAPDDGYGAPSLFERLREKLHGKYLAIAIALAVMAAAAVVVGVALLRKSRRKRLAS